MATTDSIRVPVASTGKITIAGLEKSIADVKRLQEALQKTVQKAGTAAGAGGRVSVSAEAQITNPVTGGKQKVIYRSVVDFERQRKESLNLIRDNMNQTFDSLQQAIEENNRINKRLDTLRKRKATLQGSKSGKNVASRVSSIDTELASLQPQSVVQTNIEEGIYQSIDLAVRNFKKAGIVIPEINKKLGTYLKNYNKRAGVKKYAEMSIKDVESTGAANAMQNFLEAQGSEIYDSSKEALREVEKNSLHQLRMQRDRFKFGLKKKRKFPTGGATIEDKEMKKAYAEFETALAALEADAIKRLKSSSRVFNRKRRDLDTQIATGRAAGLDVTSLEEQKKALEQQSKRFTANRARVRKETEAQNRLAAIGDLETQRGIAAAAKNNADNRRRKNLNSGIMAGASAGIGLLGQAGFPILNVGFAALSGGMMAAGIAAVATILGEGARAFQRFNDAATQTADKLGFVTSKFKLINAQLEGTRTGFSVLPQMQTQISNRMQTEFLNKNYEIITKFQRLYESGKVGGKAAGYSYLENLFMNPKNLIPGYSLLQFGRMGYGAGYSGGEAYGNLSPESQLFEAKEMYRKMQQNLLKPLAAIEADPFEVWKRIQQAALETGKAEEMRIAREQLDAAKTAVVKLQEIVDMGKRKSGPAILDLPFPATW